MARLTFSAYPQCLGIKTLTPYRIKGIDHIVAVLGGSSYDDHTGGRTNFAVRDDQTAYDLATLLPSWGIEQ